MEFYLIMFYVRSIIFNFIFNILQHGHWNSWKIRLFDFSSQWIQSTQGLLPTLATSLDTFYCWLRCLILFWWINCLTLRKNFGQSIFQDFLDVFLRFFLSSRRQSILDTTKLSNSYFTTHRFDHFYHLLQRFVAFEKHHHFEKK